ncbi:MAG: HAD family hydrolase [Ruminococcus sp.]
MKLIDKSKRKLKKQKIRALMKNRFILEGYYKYGDCDKSFFRKGIYLLSLYFSHMINGKNSRRPYVYERKKYAIKPCISAPESSFAKRPSYTQMAKNILVNDVISFDVFDTLILRPFDNPKSVFFILGELNKCPGFKRYRELAEKLARKEAFEKTGSHEVTLRDIYEKLSRFVILDIEKAMEYEIETELNLAFPNPYMMKVFKEAKNLNKKIIAVSDMYLPKEVIEKMLLKCGYDGFDDIIISNEYGTSKRKCGLYEIVKNKYGENTRYLHIGDNYVSDNLSAEKSGISPIYYKNVNARGNAHRAFDMTSLIGSAYRGIVNAKLQNGDKTYSQYYEYGYTYAGFLVLGYCNYIHNYAKNNNIEKILFLSRDGHILKSVYDSLFPGKNTEYVYWSRSAATKLTVKKFRNELLLRYIKYKIPRQMTMEKILTAMDMPQMQKPLEDKGFTPDTVLTKKIYEDIIKVFIDNWDIVVNRFEQSNKAAEEYYKQVIGNSKSACIVDIGWAASGFSALRYLIEDEWQIDCKVSGLVAGSTYLHDMDIIETQLTKKVISSYMFSQRKNREIRRDHNIKQMYSVFTEIMLSAPTPSFIGFDYDENGDIKYEFDCPETEGYEMIEEIQQGIRDFVKDYTTAFKDYPFMCNISGSDAYAVCRQVISCPDYFKNLFADYPVNRAVGSASYEMGTLGDLINNEFVK